MHFQSRFNLFPLASPVSYNLLHFQNYFSGSKIDVGKENALKTPTKLDLLLADEYPKRRKSRDPQQHVAAVADQSAGDDGLMHVDDITTGKAPSPLPGYLSPLPGVGQLNDHVVDDIMERLELETAARVKAAAVGTNKDQVDIRYVTTCLLQRHLS